MLRKIRVYGQLAKFLKQRVFEADVASAAEAVRFLVANFPKLESHMSDQYYKVKVDKVALSKDELHYPVGQEDIKIVPVIAGAGGGGSKILIGAALIGLSFVSLGAGTAFAGMANSALFAGASATAAGAGIGSTILATVGLSLVLGGVSELISPVPQIPQGPDTNQDPRKTFSFSGIQQTSRQGVPVPIVYGETIVGSVVVSAKIDTVKVNV